MSRFPKCLASLLPLAGALALASCDGMGSIGGPSTGSASGNAGASVDPTGAAGNSGGAAGATSTGTGAAGTGASSTGAAGTGTSGAGTAGTGSSGAAGRTGAAGTGTAGTGATSGAAGRGTAGTTGAAGTGTTTGAAGTGTTTGAAGTGAVVQMPHCKRGEAYQANSLGDLQALSKGISWWYNWSTAPEQAAAGWQNAGLEFVPMVWGQKGGPPDPATIEKQIPAGAKYILGFNEPNRGDQSNITAAQAAALWPRIMQIAKDRNLKIGSPSPQYCSGNCNDTDPFHWLDAFFAACTGCQVDFMATHWYACTADALKNHLAKFKKYGRPIWVTEFSCMDAGDHSDLGEQAYMKTAVDILENDPTVFRYSWFTGRWPALTSIGLLGSASGTLSALGNQYMILPATNVCGQ